MPSGAFVSYVRVSTERQGRSGLGLQAQRDAVKAYLNGGDWRLVAEITEVESGKNDDRPKLTEALRLCRLHNATLVIAKIDRLSRDVHFLTGLQKAGVRFVATDMPEANEMIVQIMATVAQAERKMISTRTKAALAAKAAWYAGLDDEAKADLQAQGKAVRLGGKAASLKGKAHLGNAASAASRGAKATGRASDVAPIIAELQASGMSLRQVAAALTARAIPTPRGAGAWTAIGVKRAMERAAVAA